MPRRNHSGRRPQAARVRVQPLRPRQIRNALAARLDVDPSQIAPLVKPDGVCEPPVGKRKFAFFTEGKADNALASARRNRELDPDSGHHKETRFYECTRAAKWLTTYDGQPAPAVHYHLTHLSEEEWEGGHK